MTEELIAEARAFAALGSDLNPVEANRLIFELADELAAAGAAPQEPGVVCAWCPGHARGSAWHNDGSLRPSCGQIHHGGGWVPSRPGSVIDEVGLSNVLMQVYDNGSQPNALPEARAIIEKADEWLRGGGQ